MFDRLGTWFGERKAVRNTAVDGCGPQERRVEPRFDLGNCACLTLRLDSIDEEPEREVSVHNLSTRGVAFRVEENAPPLSPGQELRAHAVIEETEHPVTLQITRASDDAIGCRLLAPQETSDALDALLEPIRRGKQLRPIDPRFVAQRASDDGELQWFQGGAGCDVYVWSKPDAIVRTQLFFNDRVVEWSEDHGVRTGEVRGKERSGYAQAETFALTSPPDADALAIAQRILCAADALPDQVRTFANTE